VVDDDPEFREPPVGILAGMGLSVVAEVATVEPATSAGERLRPLPALVEVGLPDGDGVILARALAALPWGPCLVVTSTDPDAISEATAKAVGGMGFIAKHEPSRRPSSSAPDWARRPGVGFSNAGARGTRRGRRAAPRLGHPSPVIPYDVKMRSASPS
jgi:CheY-like chemotaxis protein